MGNREKLTGRTRLRPHTVGTFNKRILLVLQIEVTYPDGPGDWHGMPEYLAGTVWRDATISDVTQKETS